MHTGRRGLSKVIKIDYLSRIEGESGVYIEIKEDSIKVQMRVFEAPRFFESFLRGRPFQDAIDFTARICGICPVAYQMSSVHAIEKIFGIDVDKHIRDLRRLMYCAEWISSHSLHVYLLHGPDFYGLESAWASKEYLPILKKGLFFKRLGNELLTILGGRSIHPVNVRVGGFYKEPDIKKLKEILPSLEKAFEDSLKEIKWVSTLKYQKDSSEREYLSLRNDKEYPMNYGNVVSSKGLSVDMEDFLNLIEEYQKEYSTALFSGIKRDKLQPYLVGPIARLNLNYHHLTQDIKDVIYESGIEIPITDLNRGIIARVIEISYAFYESIRLIKSIEGIEGLPEQEFEPCSGSASWITEAPRGMLIHQYELDDTGRIANCRLIPPTSQNLAMMEEEIKNLVGSNKTMDKTKLTAAVASLIRSFDPCISCSVHLL